MNNIIRVVTIIRIVRRMKLFSVIQLITIHLGRKPIKGGNPPRDIKFIMIENLVIFLLFMMLII